MIIKFDTEAYLCYVPVNIHYPLKFSQYLWKIFFSFNYKECSKKFGHVLKVTPPKSSEIKYLLLLNKNNETH